MQSGESPKSSLQLHQLQGKQQQLVAQLQVTKNYRTQSYRPQSSFLLFQFAQHAITLAMLSVKQEEEKEERLRHR